jgi:hypothetical protein
MDSLESPGLIQAQVAIIFGLVKIRFRRIIHRPRPSILLVASHHSFGDRK